MQLQPVFNRVLIQIKKQPDALVLLPEGSAAPLQTYRVLAIGPDVKCCSVGDDVMLVPGANVLGVTPSTDPEPIGLTHDSSIIAVAGRGIEIHETGGSRN